MQLDTFDSATEFLRAAGNHLQQAEVENALILGVARSLASAPLPPVHPPWFALVRDGDTIVTTAFSSMMQKLAITRSSHPGALPLVAEAAVEACPWLTDINGPEPTATELAAVLTDLTGQAWSRKLAMRIHRLDRVAPLDRSPAGTMRTATDADIPMLAQWVEDFMLHTGDRGNHGELAAARVRAGQVFIWDDNEPVAMAGWSGKTPNGVRVNLVYTPQQLRGRGYATAIVTALSRRLLDEGNRWCCLYTDLANPTSNAIYARIGYVPVCDTAVFGTSDS